MVGTPVFRIVVSSDSMKNATAINQGRRRLLESAREGGAERLFARAGFCGFDLLGGIRLHDRLNVKDLLSLTQPKRGTEARCLWSHHADSGRPPEQPGKPLGALLRGLPFHLINLGHAGIAHCCNMALRRDGYEIHYSIRDWVQPRELRE